MASIVDCVERATSDMLIGPDWAINIEICDIINRDPGQANDALKALKKRLGSKDPEIQLLALVVLETLSKNCGQHVHLQIVECDILPEMVKIVKIKPNLNVREKILVLLDTWQEAFGGHSSGRFFQYYAAYKELKDAGVEYPPRAENSVPLFTPQQSLPITHQSDASVYGDASVRAPFQSDASALSLAEIQNAQGISVVLMEMLEALDPCSSEDIKQEVIVDLVDQCQAYQKRVMLLVNSTSDEELLCHGLALNDDLQRVLHKYDERVKGAPATGNGVVGVATSTSAAPTLVDINRDDDEADDDFSQLAQRSSRDNVLSEKSTSSKTERTYVRPLLPPPPSSKRPIIEATRVDYLSGDIYGFEQPPEPPEPTPRDSFHSVNIHTSLSSTPPLTLSSPPHKAKPVSSSLETAKSTERLSSAPWETPSFGSLLQPPSKYNQRQQQALPRGPDYSLDGLLGETQHLSLNSDGQESSPLLDKQGMPEDTLFKDLVDFARAKSSSSTKHGNSRTD